MLPLSLQVFIFFSEDFFFHLVVKRIKCIICKREKTLYFRTLQCYLHGVKISPIITGAAEGDET